MIIMVMRMLGEMAVANPRVGSFMEYCREALGDWAGFAVGWLYWYFWAIVLAVEAVAGAEILQNWLPGIPIWVMSRWIPRSGVDDSSIPIYRCCIA